MLQHGAIDNRHKGRGGLEDSRGRIAVELGGARLLHQQQGVAIGGAGNLRNAGDARDGKADRIRLLGNVPEGVCRRPVAVPERAIMIGGDIRQARRQGRHQDEATVHQLVDRAVCAQHVDAAGVACRHLHGCDAAQREGRLPALCCHVELVERRAAPAAGDRKGDAILAHIHTNRCAGEGRGLLPTLAVMIDHGAARRHAPQAADSAARRLFERGEPRRGKRRERDRRCRAAVRGAVHLLPDDRALEEPVGVGKRRHVRLRDIGVEIARREAVHDLRRCRRNDVTQAPYRIDLNRSIRGEEHLQVGGRRRLHPKQQRNRQAGVDPGAAPAEHPLPPGVAGRPEGPRVQGAWRAERHWIRREVGGNIAPAAAEIEGLAVGKGALQVTGKGRGQPRPECADRLHGGLPAGGVIEGDFAAAEEVHRRAGEGGSVHAIVKGRPGLLQGIVIVRDAQRIDGPLHPVPTSGDTGNRLARRQLRRQAGEAILRLRRTALRCGAARLRKPRR